MDFKLRPLGFKAHILNFVPPAQCQTVFIFPVPLPLELPEYSDKFLCSFS